MCGIAGFYGFKDDDLIKKISGELAHRGPDGEGFHFDNVSTLLNRRLAIIDLKTGDQPIYNEDKTVVVVYNGEIYNFAELKEKLVKAGHVFTTKTDTEVIVHGYEEWGVKCFDRLNGMFGIALRDIKKNKLFLVRDHFGIKPLYYAQVGSKVIFSSEIRPIFHSGLLKKQPNDRVIYRYLKYRIHDEGTETFFKNIYRLKPGEMLEVDEKGAEIKKYTTLQEDLLRLASIPKKHNVTENDISHFKKELIKAIKYRLIADVSVGTCLSGGLDSSTVVAIVNKLLLDHTKEAKSVGQIQKTFSAVFPGGTNDEEKYVDALVSKLDSRINVFKVRPKPAKFFEEIRDFIRSQEEPTISTGPYAQYKVMEKAHGKVKVLLDGQGSDEMMAGYMPYYMVYYRQLLKERKYAKLLAEVSSSLDVVRRYAKDKLSQPASITSLLKSDFVNKYKKETFNVVSDNLKKRLIEDVFSNSLQSLLRYEDKNAMRFSIEGRVPFLDFNLIRFIFSLPDEAIIKGGWNKYILRQATKDLLPPVINGRRNKIGFTTPEYQWFMEKKNEIFDVFSSTSFGSRKYFEQKKVLLAFQEFLRQGNFDTMVFWRMINVELWLKEFFDQKEEKVADKFKLGQPNKGKKLRISVGKLGYMRYPVKTGLFRRGDDYASLIANYAAKSSPVTGDKPWLLVVSEKVVAISQGRSRFIWEIVPSPAAQMLSMFVKRTPYGIGLGSPWTMQMAIDEVGLPKILLATVVSALTKALGIGGMFYRIAGDTVRSIDGPTEYSLYPSNVSAKLGPKNPQDAARKIHSLIKGRNFQGCVIIDANDLGRNVLGNSTNLPDKQIEKIMADNPMGQGSESTPLTIVVKN